MIVAKHKFDSHQYHQIVEAGIFEPENRLELIKGEIIQMSPIGIKHAVCVARLDRLLQRLLSDRAFIWVQSPIRLDNGSEPQPDLALLKLRDDFERLPIPEDILLIIEVSDSTIDYDSLRDAYRRHTKMPLYAEFAIPEAWLVDVNENTLTRFTKPSPSGYKSTESLDRNDVILLLEVEIIVRDIWGN